MWFGTAEIKRMSWDPDWLDKALRIVEKQMRKVTRWRLTFIAPRSGAAASNKHQERPQDPTRFGSV
jgi:hypothetical protein